MGPDIIHIGALLALVTVGIATPGPNNMTCFVHSGVHGWRKTVSLIFGMVIGFVALNSFVLLIVIKSSGIESVSTFIHWMGVVFIVLLGLAISRISAVFEVTRISASWCEDWFPHAMGEWQGVGFRVPLHDSIPR
jgi:threonine/homoserine/homoserine lactone efflux protein